MTPFILVGGLFLYNCETLKYDVQSLLEMPDHVRPWYRDHIQRVLTPEQRAPWMKAFNWIDNHPNGELPECDVLDKARGPEKMT